MFLSDVSIKRPVAMSCLIIALTLLGLNSWRKMGLEMMPNIDIPFITVVTVYPGASPSEIETDVAKRIEDAVVSIEGLKHISSACMENVCQTFLEFELGVDVDIAATDVREKLDLIKSDLPSDAEDPKIQKFDLNATPIVTLALTGDVPLDQLYDYADNTLRDRISVMRGVADVSLIGGAAREVHIVLDRNKLAARNLSSMQVVQAIQESIQIIPSGRIKESDTEYAVKFDADYKKINDIGSLEIAGADGRRCYIRDIGEVRMASEELRQSSTLDGKPCITIRVVKKSDANAVEVTRSVREGMASLQEQLPGGMELVWVTDDGKFIEATNWSAWMNVFQGIVLTALILFLFLYNLQSLIIVAITMPLTIIVGLFFMQMADFTLNTSTLIAIGMSVGILVTNSIVVLEAIIKRLNETGDPKKAAGLGASEAFIAILASAGTNIVVLFPLAIMGSMVGLFIKPLALTMFIMTVVSLFLSFTLTPMLASLLLKPRDDSSMSILRRIEKKWDSGLQEVINLYRRVLEFNERHRTAAIMVIILVLGIFIHSTWLSGNLGSSMVEDPDKGEIFVKMEFPTRNNINTTMERTNEAIDRLKDVPELKHILSMIGKVEGVVGQSSEGVHLAQILMKFSERDEREITMDELLSEVRTQMEDFPGAIVSVSIPSMIGGQSTPIEMQISGNELETLDSLALWIQGLAEEIPGISDPDTTVREGKPEVRVYPQRAVLADLKMSPAALGMTMRANLEGVEAGTYKENDRNYDIVVKLEEEQGKNQIEQFLLPGAPGHPLALTSVADIEETIAPIQITREDKQRAAKFLSQLSSSLPMGTAVQEINKAIKDNGGMPPGYNYRFAGEYEAMAEGQEALGEAGLIAIILVVLALAAILESFKQPWLILVTVPLALIGMIWGLALTGQSLGIFAIMGMVMMIGIVVNNAILIVDQFNVHVGEGVPRHKAMITAACERFRPIVMITIAAVLGMMPLALGRGIGAEIRNGVGIASVGGILVSGILTLIVVPILYDLFTRKGNPVDNK